MPSKKKKPPRRKPRAPARFATGGQIRVKSGTWDPNYSDIPIGGWAGIIVEIDQRSYPPTYLIEWHQHTLEQMHPIYRKRCARRS